MISKMTKNKGTVVRFGKGTVRVNPYLLKGRPGAQIELTQCRAKEVGGDVGPKDVVPQTQKVVLDFTSVESIDVLIQKLNLVREDLLEEMSGVKSKRKRS